MTTESARRFLEGIIEERGENYSSISRLIGRNPAYIQQFIKRGTPRKLDERDRSILARYFSVAEHLLGGLAQPEEAGTAKPQPSNIVRLPRLSLGASAGAGSVEEEQRPKDVVVWDARWLRCLGAQPPHVSIIQVDGESMAPTLQHGDDIMVDHSDDMARLRDGIYVLRLDGVLVVKRIAIGPRRGMFSVVSDNPHYPDWSDVEPELVTIVGRVIWIGRALR